MKRLPAFLALVVLGLGSALSASADEQPSMDSDASWAHSRGFRHLERCLSRLDLSSDQRAGIEPILASGRETLRTDLDALEDAHEKLRDDLAGGADKCVLGQDLLDREAQAETLRAHAQEIRDQILAKLTPEQQERFNACAAGRRTRRVHERSDGAP